jgi:hypothetical protein
VSESVSYSRVAVVEAKKVREPPEEGQRPGLEAVTRRLVKTQRTENTYVCALVTCKVCESVERM